MHDEPDRPQDGFDGDDDYRPDPSALRIAGQVIRRRAALPGFDAQTAADLIEYAADYANLAARIDGLRPEPALERSLNCVSTEAFWTTDAFTGVVERALAPSMGVELLTFTLTAAHQPDAVVAMAELIGPLDGAWEILHAEVQRSQRRKGLATLLYDRIEEFLGAELRPSGWLSEDAYAFWRRRDAASVAGYRRVEPFLRLWISPKQLLNLMTIDLAKLEAWMESAAADAPQRLH